MSILKSSFTVSAWTGISRVMGFVRDIVIANKLGASSASDAFFIALLLPNLFRRLFGEGAFQMAFLPIFSGEREKGGQDAAEYFAAVAITWLLIALAAVILLAQVFMPSIVSIFFSKETTAETFNLTVFYGQITFSYLFFITIAALMGSVTNTYNRFVFFASMPILLNISFLSCLFILPEFGLSAALAASIAVPLGGVFQLGFMAYALRRIGFRLRLKWPPKHPELSTLLERLGPAMITVGFLQLSFMLDNMFAGHLAWWVQNPENLYIPLGDNAVSYLNYANKFYQFPLAMIGLAMATVLLPHFAKALQRNDHTQVRRSFHQSFVGGTALAVASTAGLFILAEPLMRTFFEHGKLDTFSAQMSAWAMMGYCLGLPGFIATKITASAFYAKGDTRTPVKAVMWTLVVNIIANIVLIQYLGHVGIAAATAISGWLNAWLQFYWLKKAGFVEIDVPKLMPELLKAVAVGGAILGFLLMYQVVFAFSDHFFQQFVWVIGAVISGVVLFLASIHYSGLYDVSSIAAKILSRTSQPNKK